MTRITRNVHEHHTEEDNWVKRFLEVVKEEKHNCEFKDELIANMQLRGYVVTYPKSFLRIHGDSLK